MRARTSLTTRSSNVLNSSKIAGNGSDELNEESRAGSRADARVTIRGIEPKYENRTFQQGDVLPSGLTSAIINQITPGKQKAE